MKIFMALFCLLSVCVSQAHTLKENSAEIIMREGQVEIRLRVNMARWQRLLQSNQSWLLGDIQQVMPSHSNPAQQAVFLSDILSQQTHVSVNKHTVKMAVLYFPEFTSLSEINLLTSHHQDDFQKDNHHRENYAEIVLTAQHQQGNINNIRLTLPKSLGNVHSRFVQPKYRLIKAGNESYVTFKKPSVVRDKLLIKDH